MLLLVALWALAEAVVFFIVADVPIMALAARRGVGPGLVAAMVAATCAAIGGVGLAHWASLWPSVMAKVILALPAIDEALLRQVHDDWDAHGTLAMIQGSFSGVPYKLYALVAGATNGRSMSWLVWFFLASVTARLPRFALVALAGGWIGPRLRAYMGERNFWIAYVLAWVAFYSWYFTAMSS